MPLETKCKCVFLAFNCFYYSITCLSADNEWFKDGSVCLMVPAVDTQNIHLGYLVQQTVFSNMNKMGSMFFRCFLLMLQKLRVLDLSIYILVHITAGNDIQNLTATANGKNRLSQFQSPPH